MSYIIRSTEKEDGEPLYWNNEFGWVTRAYAEKFPDKNFNLPIGGTWEEIDEIRKSNDKV